MYRLGPAQVTGEVRSAKTGSKRTRTPRSACLGVGNSISQDAWPSHVARSLEGELAPQVGCRTETSSVERRPEGREGTGTKFLSGWEPKRALSADVQDMGA